MLYTLLVLFPVSLWLRHRNSVPGTQLVVASVLYALYRFPTDFLRVIDTRYWGLTPGQYASVVLLVLAVWQIRSSPSTGRPNVAKAPALD